jgi:hypothetical protein
MAHGRPKKWTRDSIKEALKGLADENGYVTYKQPGIGGIRDAAVREFGSWREACKAAGVHARPRGRPSKPKS